MNYTYRIIYPFDFKSLTLFDLYQIVSKAAIVPAMDNGFRVRNHTSRYSLLIAIQSISTRADFGKRDTSMQALAGAVFELK